MVFVMPELPEVETVRRALEPEMVGVVFDRVICNRKNLRFEFPRKFVTRLEGTHVDALTRRGKYMLAELSSGETLIMHLGMSGRFTVMHEQSETAGEYDHHQETKPAHDHVIFQMGARSKKNQQKASSKAKATKGRPPRAKPTRARIVYNDPRRFGFMDLVKTQALETCKHFAGMGPEPLGNEFSGAYLAESLNGRKSPIKQALLDQRIVAGLGNIYVCEALFRAGISPKRQSGRIADARLEALVVEVRQVLRDAIHAGGSSLKDFASSDGSPGYFQHDFQIYGREGEPCRKCDASVRRIVQGGRSTFYCQSCQR